MFCKENDLLYLELIDLFKGQEDKFLFDGLHPNTEGHKLIYKKVKPEIEKVVRS
jgi:lysophospholipase L1-like esterase